MKQCPKCGSQCFCVTAHVTQDWLVDADGDFLECTKDCVEVTHRPDDDDIWQCDKCGYSAAGSEFNVAEPKHLNTEKTHTAKKRNNRRENR